MSFDRNGNDSQRRMPFSAASNGQPISLGSSATSTNIHTTLSSNQVYDEIWMYVSNIGASNAVVTVSWSGTSSMKLTIPASAGLTLVSPGLLLTGTGSATKSVAATDTSNTGNVYVFGYVLRSTL